MVPSLLTPDTKSFVVCLGLKRQETCCSAQSIEHLLQILQCLSPEHWETAPDGEAGGRGEQAHVGRGGGGDRGGSEVVDYAI